MSAIIESEEIGTSKYGEAVSLIENREFEQALEMLAPLADDDDTGECRALMGLACFHLERYPEARAHYEVALEKSPDRIGWQAMRERAWINEKTQIQVFVPEYHLHDAEALLAAPRVGEDTLPAPPEPFKRSIVAKVANRIGAGVGWVATKVTDVLVHGHGRWFGYRDAVWTNWYRRGKFRAILTLAYMRDLLNKNNLKVTYPGGELIGFQKKGQTPPPGVTHYRTADGSWNNLANPKEGAAGTRFTRNVENAAIQPESGNRLMSPNPRLVSRRLLTRGEKMKEVPFLNLLAASWIQFQNHDWVSHGENLDWPHMHEIPLDEDDPARRRYRQTKMYVGKTQPDPTYRESGEPTPITYINEVTHWWDGSQIYGSDQETQDRLRSRVDGKLRVTDRGLLPLHADGVEDTGFRRNWWVGLAMLHTLFVREHNAICDRLKQKYPHWDDNRLFNVARLVNAAVMAKIHTIEWTPAVLPNRDANRALNANWYGIATYEGRRRKHRQARATLNIRHPETGGVVGNPIDKHDSPYGLTEEFVEVYRLHSLLPETLDIKRHDSGVIVDEPPVPATRQAGSPELTGEVEMADLFYSFGNQLPGQLVLNNYPRFLQELSIPGNPVFDMGAVDILRARERGVPRYNEFREQLGLNRIRRFEDLTDDAEELRALEEVYGDSPEAVEDLDLLVGTLAERHRPTNFGFGETLFQIFILNATRRLQADRFYTDFYNEETYTKEGLDWIDDADLKTVLLRHYPELGVTGLANVRNAFEPWDTARVLDPARHPLRAYDKEIADDPWVGDMYR